MTRIARRATSLAASITVAAWMSSFSPAHAGPADVPARAAVCAACHGAQGEGNATGVPRLAGQNAQYLEHALSSFKSGTRASTTMQPVAQGLSDADVHELAAYFAALHASRAAAPVPARADVAAGKELAEVGAPRDPTPPCISCHGIGGRGDKARYPSLAGQPAEYLVNRLHEFQARAKAKQPEPLTMTDVAAHLDETQIRQVAAYLSTLPPP